MFDKSIGRNFYLVSAAIIACGCGPEPKDPTAGMTQQQRLDVAVNKIESDPEASPIAKRIADGAIQRTKNDDAVKTFEDGGQ